ncbi:MAG: hypothetical protein WAX66_00460 [Patescibacteria group bacterium]
MRGILKDIVKPQFLLKIGLVLCVFLSSSYLKYKVLDEAGGDFSTYKKAVRDFIAGKNIYKDTVESYEPGSTKEHGYAYFPTMLYIYSPLYKLSLAINYPLQRVWKASVFIADIGVGLMILKILWKKSYWAALAGVTFWWLNPFLTVRNSGVYTEPFGILFMLLALYYLEKDDIKAGICYAVSFSFKSFPVILLPLFLIKSKNKVKFLLGAAVFAIIISIPFMISIQDFMWYVQGAFFVHGSREPQGRPLLFFITYYTSIPLFSLVTANIYRYVCIVLGWVLTSYLQFKKKILDKYILSMISFAVFYLFTPVLTRTYILWFIPVYTIGMFDVFEKKKEGFTGKNKIYFFLSLIAFYAFYAWYLSLWSKGLRIKGDVISL